MRNLFRTLLAIACLAIAAVAQAELIGHWTFDEGSGATAYDSSGKGYDGTISGAVYGTGQIGSGALQFDGVDDHVEVPYCDDLALVNTEYTIAFWVKPDTSGTYENSQIYIGNNDMNDYVGGYSIYRNNGYYAKALVNTDTGGKSTFASLPQADTWTHLAVIYDGVSVSVYTNGALDYYEAGCPSSVASGLINADNTPYDPLWFGALHGYDWYHFKGAMDDIQIYDQALSLSELGTVVAGGTVPEPSTFVMLIAGLLGLLTCNLRKRK